MTCGSCGEKNRDGARFCAECGNPLERTCTTCDAPLTATAKFCDQCATPTSRAPAPADDGAVRKTVTVIFADLVGSTAFGEAVDAETARREMAAYHQLAQRVIDRHRGSLVKFIGDGVMAVFGVPEIAEDDADRAIRAGLDLQAEFRAVAAGIAERHGATVGLRVGINTGEIAIAEDDDDMVGDAINTAARIEAECTPGRVLVGEQTWRLTRSGVDYEVLGEVHVKGKEEGVATFQVLATTDEEIATPFVGREEELLRLRAALDDTIDDRTARLVSVIGAPGVGKTRLAAEMSERAGGGVTAFDLRVDRAATATFGPVSDLLGAVPNAVRRAEDADDADRLVPLLATFAGSAPARSTEESFWAARRLVELIVAQGPAVIVVDDVQWAQPLFLDLLDHLVEWVDGPALIIALARPEIREIRPALAEAGRRVADVISLEGLDAATTELLAARILGADALPAGLAERLPESTEGNPLFVRELVRMLVDDGTIAERNGEWALSIDAEAVEVPPTIQSLLASRVERMDDDARRVVEMASVVGSEFARGAVAALIPDMARTSLDRILEGLRRREVIDPTGSYWGDEPVLRFHHVLIRDAAYRRLLKERRADLHIRVADWTEVMATATGGDHDLAVAFHLEQAHGYLGELGPLDDAGRDAGSRAADLLATGADEALQQDDLAAAGTLAVRALALIDAADPRRPEILLIGCEAFFQAARVNDADPLLADLVEQAGGDARLGAWATAFQCHRVALTEPDALVDAEPRVAAAAETLDSLDDDAGVAKARLVRALILARLGRVGDCETELDAALHAARAADDRRRITAVLGAAPVAALWGPSPVARAGGRCLDIIRLLRITSASPMVEATSIRCQAVLEAMRGRFDKARQLIERSRAIVDELGLRHGVLETEMFRGYIELLADDPVEAEPHLRAAYEGLGRLGVGADAGQAAAHLARALLALGRNDEAADLAERSDALAGQNLQTAITSRAVRAGIASRRGDHDAARALADEAVAIAARTDLTMDHADAEASLAAALDRPAPSPEGDAARARAAALYGAKGSLGGSSGPWPIHPEPEPTTAGLHNAASQHAEQLMAAMRGSDLAAALVLVADHWTGADHRPSSAFDLTREMLTDYHAATTGAGQQTVQTMVAKRGDRLALLAHRVTESEFDWEFVQLAEIDRDGLLVHTDVWEPSDLRDALDELTKRYKAGEGAEYAEMVELAWRLGKSQEADPDEQPALMAHLCHDDMAIIDHQPVGFPDSDLTTATEQGLLDAGMMVVSEYPRIGPDAIVVCSQKHLDGGLVRDQYLVVTMRDGKADRMEFFPAEQREEAITRFDELTATTPAPPELRNAASDGVRSFFATLYRDRDWNATRESLSDDFVIDDRRTLINSAVGVDEAQEFFSEAIHSDRTVGTALDVVAVRADDLVLAHYRSIREGSDFGSEAYLVAQIDAGGLATACVLFDIGDPEGALAELGERFRATLGSEELEMVDAMVRLAGAASGAEGTQREITDDFTFLDHRTMGFPATGRDGYLRMVEAATEQLGDRQGIIRRFLALTTNALLIENEITAQGSSWPGLTLLVRRGDRICRSEVFASADEGAALARFRELTADVPSNAASRQLEQFWRTVYRARDLDAAFALLRDDFVSTDHRRLISSPTLTKAEVREFLELFVDSAKSEIDHEFEVIATRADHLVLARIDPRDGRTGFGQAMLQLVEIDPDGLAIRATSYSLEDRERALRDLDAPAAPAPLRNGASELARMLYELVFDRDEIETMLAHVADDFGAEDTQPMSAGRMSKSDLADNFAEFAGSTGTGWNFDVVALAGERLALIQFETIRAGSEFVTSTLQLIETDGTLLAGVVVFESDDLNAALDAMDARFLLGEGAEFADTLEAAWRSRAMFADLSSLSAAFTDDFVIVDHRPIGFGTLDRDELIAFLTDGEQMAGERHLRTRRAVALDHGIILSETDLGTEELSWPMLQLATYRDGLTSRQELFDVADIDAALARFEELSDSAPPETSATRSSGELLALFAAGDRGGFAARLADDFHGISRQPLYVEFERMDKAAFIEATWSLVTEFSSHTHRVIAARGDHLAVNQLDLSSDSGFEHTILLVGEFGSDGSMVRCASFEEAQRDDALALLDAWAHDPAEVDPPLALRNRASEVVRAFYSALYDDRDFETALTLVADDLVAEDRRGLVGMSIGRSDLAENFRELLEHDGPIDWTIDVQATRGDRLVVFHITTVRGGSDFASEFLTVSEIDDAGLATATIAFAPDEFQDAVAELDARFLTGEGAEYAAILADAEEVRRSFNDLEGAAQILTDDFALVDHRTLGFGELDRDGLLDLLGTVGPREIVIRRVLAMNERGVLTDTLVRTDDTAWPSLMVIVPRGGKLCREEIFDLADEDAAFARFEELTIEASADLTPLRNRASDAVLASTSMIYDDRDLDGAIAAWAGGGWTFEDRRALMDTTVDSPGEMGEAYFAEVVAYEGEIEWEAEVLAIRGDGVAMVRQRFSRDGSGFGSEIIEVAAVDSEGWLIREIAFDADDLAAAIAEMDELYQWSEQLTGLAGRVTGGTGLSLRVERVLQDTYPASNRGDWVTVRDSMAPDFVFTSARGVTGPGSTPQNRDEYLVAIRSFSNEGTRRTSEILATRGDHLALSRFTYESDGFVIEMLALYEIDGADRITRTMVFEDNDLERARAELDAWWLASLDADQSRTVEAIQAFRPFRVTEPLTIDAGVLEGLLSDGCVINDHRPLSFGLGLDREQFIAAFSLNAAEAPVVVAESHTVHIPRLAAAGGVGRMVSRYAEGSASDNSLVFLVDAGRITQVDWFPGDDLAEAVALFDELTAEPPRGNLASQIDLAFRAALRSADHEALAELVADDLVISDHRTMVSELVDTLPKLVDSVQALIALGATHSNELIAWRGDRVAFVEMTARTEAGFEVQRYTVTQTNDAGRVRRYEIFDDDHLHVAQRRSAELWLDDDGADARPAIDPLLDMVDAFDEGGLDAIRHMLAPDFRHIVTKPLSTDGVSDTDGFIENMQVWLGLSGSIRVVGRELHQATAEGCVWVNDIYATDSTGMVTQWASTNTFLVADGKVTYWEEFEPEAVDAAIARFEELTAPGNAASRLAESFMTAMEAGAASAEAPDDFVMVDHRALATPLDSLEMGLASDAALVEQRASRDFELIAWRGERVALHSLTRETESFRLITYVLNVVDDTGAGTRLEIFDEDQFDDALRRLNELWWDDEGADFRASGELFSRMGELLAEGAWDETRDLFHPDFRHRMWKTLAHEQFDIEGYIENAIVWRDLAGSIRFVNREVLRTTTDAGVITQDINAVGAEGSETQWSMIMVLVAQDGKIINVEEFDPDNEKGALARFEELTGA